MNVTKTKFTYLLVNLNFPQSLATRKPRTEIQKENRSINPWKHSFLLKLRFFPENYITKSKWPDQGPAGPGATYCTLQRNLRSLYEFEFGTYSREMR